MTLQGEERRHLLESALEYFPVTREKVNAEPDRSLVQALALSAGCLVTSQGQGRFICHIHNHTRSQAQLLGPARTDSGIVVSIIPLPVLSTGLPTMGLLAKD